MSSTILGIIASAGAAAAAGTGYDSIATASLAGVSGTTFNSIPSTYTHLEIRFIGVESTALGNDTRIRFNSDTGSNYARHQFYANRSTQAGAGTASTTFIKATNAFNGLSTSQPSVGIIQILDYKSTSKNKVSKHFSGIDLDSSGTVDIMSGLWMSTSAITSITFEINGTGSTFGTGSSVALYGIKESA